ncbi:2-oxo acid dehydrogenase subunit E2 [Pseudomonas sp. FW306-02-F02-AA]|uniref:Dihydrolipoamide acetyltransferase component of pyruvate dehydrogenase complex n=1 Tax=Pseudomonas fluorescens TaxID=294 RepID=A0A0N7H0I6_PSEFL|nr:MULTISPECIES: dihydrolipoamide acetyltransferase family protein [Pseudomonas]ALI03244.1 branched-chain alpha-keto acid dehydrogenase subunit E2 [Pseudomonas fluorescens]PMZ01533.1 2-oxo acid dehydrogenase subunit E2 [Pseudomonas sp. FW306-02-F02-AB]PMZ07350.1 2-oxo acid dehydrogenase subunit E2 [Pseudomonas sp. FW306-02-H06C]PMZ13424.1 2-oxo acid dehydrogenase subunit E2 [Pseudomonas sp. FW306-02-F02-AA]PMZ19006.1 2-oxo acid dehydrogenase subunit E2 [Pseudomonas sp. FW306-02-F08-AA]
MIEFNLPSLGADMDEGTLLEWKIQPGDTLKPGQVIAVVDTEKAAIDVEYWHDGTVLQLLLEVGAKVPVGTPMALVLEPGESPQSVRRTATPAPAVIAGQNLAASRPRLSPVARRRAAELGLDVSQLKGHGPRGVITLEDVETAGRTVAEPDRQQAMRHAIATAMSRSKREIPHYYLSETIALGNAVAWLQAHNAQSPLQERLLPSVLLLKAVALALGNYPQLNGFWQDGAFVSATATDLGVAITLRQGGLVAPVLHDVANTPLARLMSDLVSLVERARSGSLRSSELSGAGLTVTQLGDQGVDSVLGVVYPPQVALVGFGRICERPWVKEGQLCVMPTVVSSLSADHRVSDGHYGARFLGEVRHWLQSPENL